MHVPRMAKRRESIGAQPKRIQLEYIRKVSLAFVIQTVNFKMKNDASVLPLPENDKSVCGFQKSEGYITGGRNAKQGSYSFIAAMGINFTGAPNNIGFVCGGSLINHRFGLTAAHCHSNAKPIIVVRLGEHDFAQDPDCNEQGCKSSKTSFYFHLVKGGDIFVKQ